MAAEKQEEPEKQEMEEQYEVCWVGATASLLVDNVISIVLSADHDDVSLGMDIDSMVKQFEKLIIKQQEFAMKQKPTEVDIGFHWTRSYNVDSIRRHSLMTGQELVANDISVRINGAAQGDGIYTADDPAECCTNYGAACFLVARLQGKQDDDEMDYSNVDTVGCSPVKVLRTSNQCVPLMCFARKMLINVHEKAKIFQCHLELQTMLDGFLNEGGEGTVVGCSWLKKNNSNLLRLKYLPSLDDPPASAPNPGRPPSQKKGAISPIGVFAKPGKANPFLKKRSEEAKETA